MKKFTVILLFVFAMSIVMKGQTNGELLVSTTTSETGGNYAPRNIVAIWIENDQGEFVKTLLAYAQQRKTHLNNWQAITGAAGVEYNTTDAITGATKSSHATRECSWNATDYNGIAVADGNYTVWMELTDKNATGNYSSFTFTKSDIADVQSPANVPSFSFINISWTPSGVSTFSLLNQVHITVSPNPSNGKFAIKGAYFEEVEVRSISGELVYKGNSLDIDISDQANGIYLVIIEKENSRIIKKLVKN